MNRAIRTAFVLLCAATPAFAATLFPQPLHLVRQIDDPVANGRMTVHEYCIGDRMVTVNGPRVTIADYAKQELVEIDRKAGTYSITRFSEMATLLKSQRGMRPAAADDTANLAARTRGEDEWSATPLGTKSFASGRAFEAYAFARGRVGDQRRIEVGIDRRVTLSRDAVEVLVGAAYPNDRTPEHDVLVRASAGMRDPRNDDSGSAAAAAVQATYALPAEQSTTFELAGQTVTVHNSIVSVTNEAPPDDVMQIPPGATQVESRVTRLVRELRDLDQIPGMPEKH